MNIVTETCCGAKSQVTLFLGEMKSPKIGSPFAVKAQTAQAFKDPARKTSGIHEIWDTGQMLCKYFAAYAFPNHIPNTSALFLTNTIGTNRLPTSAPALSCVIHVPLKSSALN